MLPYKSFLLIKPSIAGNLTIAFNFDWKNYDHSILGTKHDQITFKSLNLVRDRHFLFKYTHQYF